MLSLYIWVKRLNFSLLFLFIFNFLFLKSDASLSYRINHNIGLSTNKNINDLYYNDNGIQRQLPKDIFERKKVIEKINEDLRPKNFYKEEILFIDPWAYKRSKNEFFDLYRCEIGSSYTEKEKNLFLNTYYYECPNYIDFIREVSDYKNFIDDYKKKVGDKHWRKNNKALCGRTIKCKEKLDGYGFCDFINKEDERLTGEKKAFDIREEGERKKLEVEKKKEEERLAYEIKHKFDLSYACLSVFDQNKQSEISASKITIEESKNRQTQWIVKKIKNLNNLEVQQKRFQLKQNHYLNYLRIIEEKQCETADDYYYGTDKVEDLRVSDYFDLSDISPKKIFNESIGKVKDYNELKDILICQKEFQQIGMESRGNNEHKLSYLGQKFVEGARRELVDGTCNEYEKYKNRVTAIKDTLSNSKDKKYEYQKTYVLDENVKAELELRAISFDQFTQFYGNAIQQNINGELVNVLNEISDLHYAHFDNVNIQNFSAIIYRGCDFAQQCNIEHKYEMAYALSDFCSAICDLSNKACCLLEDVKDIFVDGVLDGIDGFFDFLQQLHDHPKEVWDSIKKAALFLSDTLGLILAVDEGSLCIPTINQQLALDNAVKRFDQIIGFASEKLKNKSLKQILTKGVAFQMENVLTGAMFLSAGKFFTEVGSVIKDEIKIAKPAGEIANIISDITSKMPELVTPEGLYLPVTTIVDQAGKAFQSSVQVVEKYSIDLVNTDKIIVAARKTEILGADESILDLALKVIDRPTESQIAALNKARNTGEIKAILKAAAKQNPLLHTMEEKLVFCKKVAAINKTYYKEGLLHIARGVFVIEEIVNNKIRKGLFSGMHTMDAFINFREMCEYPLDLFKLENLHNGVILIKCPEEIFLTAERFKKASGYLSDGTFMEGIKTLWPIDYTLEDILKSTQEIIVNPSNYVKNGIFEGVTSRGIKARVYLDDLLRVTSSFPLAAQ